MPVGAEPLARLDHYQLRLPVFEGPLDVLLRLIEQRQLAITDVSLVAVTDQFLAYLHSGSVPAQSLADFAAMAGRLLVLKSRSLLPSPPPLDEEPEREDLAAQLAVYQAMKAAAACLQDRERAGLRSFAHQAPPANLPPVVERLTAPPVAVLARALSRCLARRLSAPRVYTPAPDITLAGMTRRLLQRLQWRAPFSSLVGAQPSRTEVAVGFIALLSLLRRHIVDVSQATLFGEIEVVRRDAAEQAADD